MTHIGKTSFSMKTAKRKSAIEIVFFDADCLCSFIWAKAEDVLFRCLDGADLVLPDQVYDEISRVAYLKWRVDFLMRGGRLRKEGISLNGEDLSLYFELTSISRFFPVIGKGEAAGIVLAKRHDGILASNNLRDVKRYVRKFGLKHITTAEILYLAVRKGVIAFDQACQSWSVMLSKKRKLPFKTFTEYWEYVESTAKDEWKNSAIGLFFDCK